MKKKMTLREIAEVGLLVALNVVLARLLAVNTLSLKINFAFITVVLAVVRYGTLAGVLVGAVGDFVGAMLFPVGVYFPGFTISYALSGVIFGVAFRKLPTTTLRIMLASTMNEILVTLIINTLTISFVFGTPLAALIVPRLAQTVIMIAVESSTMILLNKNNLLQRVAR